jgi:hypothetical protein
MHNVVYALRINTLLGDFTRMEDNGKEISRDQRLNLLCIPWGLTVVVTFPGIFYPLFLPAGLYRLFGIQETDAIGQGGGLELAGWFTSA